MAPGLPERVQVTEFVPSADVIQALLDAELDPQQARGLLTATGSELRKRFKLGNETPIKVLDDSVKIEDLAGVLRLTSAVEIDVAPKFLGHHHQGWREDFVAIANITGEGLLLPSEPVGASYGMASDLSSLIGRMFVEAYRRNQRRPLKTYQHRTWRSWSIEGDLNLDSLEHHPDGLEQSAIILDNDNPHNAVIAQAADVLLGTVVDPAVRNDVAQIRALLPAHARPPRRLAPVAPRHRHWQPLIELSEQIVAGADLSLAAGIAQGPGLLVRTWRAWEKLLYRALRRTSPAAVRFQPEFVLGTRNGEDFAVTPDVTREFGDTAWPVDAKYRTRVDKKPRIAQPDVYEARAFLEATGAPRIVLAYPRAAAADEQPAECGSCEVFERVEIKDLEIIGVQVEVRGIGRPGGYRRFAANAESGIADLMEGAVSAAA